MSIDAEMFDDCRTHTLGLNVRWCHNPSASTGDRKVVEDARAACAGDTKMAEKDWVVEFVQLGMRSSIPGDGRRWRPDASENRMQAISVEKFGL